MVLSELFRPTRSPSNVRAAAAAVLGPALATLVGLPISGSGPGTAVSLYLLGVVAASATGGVGAGLGAAALSFVGLSFFFTAPRYTFRVNELADVIAAFVFLAVAVVVGSLVARTVAERERATRGELDARLLGYLSTKLLSGESLERVLDDFAEALLDPFGLARCEVRAAFEGTEVHARAARAGVEPGSSEVVALILGSVPLGTLTAVRPAGRRPLDARERALLEASARQAAVALERARLDTRVRGAQIDAETNRLRAALFSSVTHDLRTPLASIKAGASSLLDESVVHDPAQQRELLQTIIEETDRLNRLVGNLMDLAKIRAGALRPAREPAAMDEIVEAVLARMRPRLAPFDVRTVIRPDLPEVQVDPVQLDQVLTNLLENAAKHSPAGGQIGVAVGPFRGAVQVRVMDQGPGIPPVERERVFEAFYRGDSASERAGSGLGLAIARAIVVAHGGRIWVEGAPGGGTAVVFEIPVEETA